ERAHTLGDRRQRGRTDLRDDHCELLAAVTRRKIDRTHRNPQRTRNALQRVIAREMPVTIVVKLEVVEIEDENSELLRIPDGALDFRVDAFEEGAKVRQIGQVISYRVRAK